jgi:hypothetical protein
VHWVVGVALLFALTRYMYNLAHEGDTGRLVHQARSVFVGLSQGRWTGWEGYFALLQHIPALLAMGFGVTDTEKVFHVLGLTSLVSFALLLFWGWRSLFRTSERLALLYLAVILSGPLIWYGHSTLGEMLASAVTLGLVVACHENTSRSKILLLSLLAAIAKDTGFPFTFLLGLMACARVQAVNGTSPLIFPKWRALLLGTLCGVAVTASFNYLRFGSVTNQFYANPDFRVRSIFVQLNFFLGLWLAPNGGVLFFWPSLCLVIFLAGRSAFGDRVGSWNQAVPFLGTALVLLGLTAGYSKWFAPFGWLCWGPRLLLPWLPAVAYLLLATSGPAIERRFLAILGKGPIRTVLIAAIFSVTALPHFIAAIRPEAVGNFFFSTDSAFPKFAYLTDGDYYYQWMSHTMWTKHPILLDAFRLQPDAKPVLLSLAYGVLLAGLLFRLKGSPCPRPET